MKTIITITEMASMPGRFACSHKTGSAGRTHSTSHAGGDPSAAAAYAIQIALGCGGQYFIFAPEKVLSLIPTEFRSGGK